jgi:hypothetical protein
MWGDFSTPYCLTFKMSEFVSMEFLFFKEIFIHYWQKSSKIKTAMSH